MTDVPTASMRVPMPGALAPSPWPCMRCGVSFEFYSAYQLHKAKPPHNHLPDNACERTWVLGQLQFEAAYIARRDAYAAEWAARWAALEAAE